MVSTILTHYHIRLSSELLCVSTIHPEPWVAKGWSISRNRDLADRNQAHCFIAKVWFVALRCVMKKCVWAVVSLNNVGYMFLVIRVPYSVNRTHVCIVCQRQVV